MLVSPNAVIKRIDGLLRAHEAAEQVPRHARRQAVINYLLKKANRAAVKARDLATDGILLTAQLEAASVCGQPSAAGYLQVVAVCRGAERDE